MDWNSIIAKIFELVLFPLIIAAGSYLIVLINVKKKELQAKTDNELHKKYIDMLDTTITDCIRATNQTYVNSLKEQCAFDKEAQKKAFKQTYDAVMAILTEDAKEYLNEAINDLNTYITNKIESGVVVVKQQPTEL